MRRLFRLFNGNKRDMGNLMCGLLDVRLIESTIHTVHQTAVWHLAPDVASEHQ